MEKPCSILFKLNIDEKDNDHIREILDFQMLKTFSCFNANILFKDQLGLTLSGFSHIVNVDISDT